MNRLISNEKELVIIMGKSDFSEPYQIQPANPHNNITSIPHEIFSAFFSLIIFINCGNRETPVQIPAPMPTSCE